jgi:hypothetical protein
VSVRYTALVSALAVIGNGHCWVTRPIRCSGVTIARRRDVTIADLVPGRIVVIEPASQSFCPTIDADFVLFYAGVAHTTVCNFVVDRSTTSFASCGSSNTWGNRDGGAALLCERKEGWATRAPRALVDARRTCDTRVGAAHRTTLVARGDREERRSERPAALHAPSPA